MAAGCGRLGFDPPPGAGALDGALPDVAFDPATLVACSQPAPFLHFIDVISPGNPSTQYARWCYAGLTGSLVASVWYAPGDVMFTSSTADVAERIVPLIFGSSGCGQCFVRLEAGGLVDEGPVTNYDGD